ncbi:MAG: hypothetical protein NTX33_17945 [Propionibacteriales bacterium]|nr:hypothetical protein [Propionibacteriales bacterium]
MSGSGTPGWPGPQGPPPSGPPPYGQPAYAPTQFGQPPYGPPPGGFGGPPQYGGPPRKRRWPLFLGLGLSLLLVIGVAVTGWLYFSGRFGIGPLSAADKDAVAAITDGVDAPAWADEDQVECAVDDLIHESRSGELEKRGLIERDGDDWTYTGEWEVADATAYFDKLLDCSDDWADQVGETWQLEDTDCLEDIGTSTIGAYFARDLLTLSDKDRDDSAEKGHAKAVEELDACYAEAPAVPKGTAKPAYRSVTFTFEVPSAANGEVVINTGGAGSWTPLSGSSASVDTEEGGQRGCVEAQVVVTYPWGTTSESQAESCGTSKPKRIWWKKAKCTSAPGCYAWQLHYEGFKDYTSITARYTSNGGNCMAVSGGCADTIITQGGGRGRLVTWSFPASYDGAFVARIGKLSARIKN